MWAAISLTARIAIIAYTAVVGLGAALTAMGVITALPKLDTWVWFVSLIVLGVENVVTLVIRHFRSRKVSRSAKLDDALASALIQIVRENPNLHLEELGANVYRFSRWDRFRRAEHSQTRLKRIARFRPGRYPQESGVAWSAAKGTVGLCWSMKKRVHKDWHAVAERWGNVELDPKAFETIPEATRCGFTLTEFQAIVGKYSEVLAEPIWDPRKNGVIIGVITIDRAHRAGTNEVHMAQLDKRATHGSAGIAAGVVSRILRSGTTED